MSNQTDSKREISRAERVRARRQAEQQNAHRKKSAVRQQQPYAHPAVKAKTNAAGNPFARPVTPPRQKPRSVEGFELTKPSVNRRITIPLNQQGAEIEFSTLPVMNIGWRLLSATIAAASVAAIIFLFFFTKVEAAEISGVSPHLTNEVQYYLNLIGKPVFLIEPRNIKEELEKGFPEIESVNVKINFPAQVTITAESRQPVYAWIMDDQVFLIDEVGTFYPAEAGTSIDGLIVVQADSMPEMKLEFEKSEDILIEIIQYTKSDDPSPSNDETTTRGESYTVAPSVINALEQILQYIPSEAKLIYHQRHGFGWYDEQGWDAYFGFELEQIDMKIAVYDSIVKNLKHQGIDATIISVEYLHAPYYRED